LEKLDRSALIERLARVRLLTLDVDGVLTDGGLYFGEDGRQWRRFNVKDGLGIKRAVAAGTEVALITASHTDAIHHRGKVLGLRHVLVGVEDKLAALTPLAADLGIGLEAVAHMGDDLNDLPVLAAVGLPLTVTGAVDDVVAAAAYVTEKRGGEGAVREICDLLVMARGGAEQ